MSTPSSKNGFFTWLGRQVGHVKKAVVEEDKQSSISPPSVIYRKDRVEEKEMPDQPGMKLRRTVIDEVIVQARPKLPDETPGDSAVD
ncbi:MAG TPA: hypothetical protein VG326_05235 [Tepidisphaeraceae bacterium]|jgi:hypothetical protein|nr:hypothetical protein [Tepidisphaeraceae bacterium]